MTRWILASASPRRRELLRQMGLQFEVIPSLSGESSVSEDPKEYVMDLAEHKACEVFEREVIPTFPQRPEDTACVIGADTIVVCGGTILGKPKDRADAAEMIRMLQGHSHKVMTGVTVVWAADEEGLDRSRLTSDSAAGGGTHLSEKSAQAVSPRDQVLAAPAAMSEMDDRPSGLSSYLSIDDLVLMVSFVVETTVTVNPMSGEEIASYLETGEADDKAGAYGIQGAFGKYIDRIEGDYYNVVGLPISALYRTLRENSLL